MARIIDSETIAVTNDTLIIYRGSDLYEPVVNNWMRPSWQDIRQRFNSRGIHLHVSNDNEKGDFVAFLCPVQNDKLPIRILEIIESKVDNEEVDKGTILIEAMPRDKRSVIVRIVRTAESSESAQDTFIIGDIDAKSIKVHRGKIITFRTKLGVTIKCAFAPLIPLVLSRK
jgi:hypothetical protein